MIFKCLYKLYTYNLSQKIDVFLYVKIHYTHFNSSINYITYKVGILLMY